MSICKNILKGLLVCMAVLTSIQNGKAENVTQKQAMQLAQTFFNQIYGEVVVSPKLDWNGRQLTTDRLFAPFYIYNHPRGGFVIIPADSKAYPIIGYSKTGKFDRSKLNDQETELLKKYAREIELIRYDSRIPQNALYAWQNLPLYVNKILNNPYNTPEFESLTEQQKENLEEIDRRNNAIMLPSAVEFQLYDPDLYREYTLDDVTAEQEEIPFKFFEDFINEIKTEQSMRLAELDEIISPTKPVIVSTTGAHYTIRFPQNINLVRIYNMQGMRVMERSFKDSDLINLDISSLPAGFYAMLALGDDGHIYGIKLYR